MVQWFSLNARPARPLFTRNRSVVTVIHQTHEQVFMITLNSHNPRLIFFGWNFFNIVTMRLGHHRHHNNWFKIDFFAFYRGYFKPGNLVLPHHLTYFWMKVVIPRNNSALARDSPAHCRFPRPNAVIWLISSWKSKKMDSGWQLPYWETHPRLEIGQVLGYSVRGRDYCRPGCYKSVEPRRFLPGWAGRLFRRPEIIIHLPINLGLGIRRKIWPGGRHKWAKAHFRARLNFASVAPPFLGHFRGFKNQLVQLFKENMMHRVSAQNHQPDAAQKLTWFQWLGLRESDPLHP